MADWEDEDFEPSVPTAVTTVPITDNKWEGEDEDDDIKDNWEDDSGDDADKNVTAVVTKPVKKKPLAERIAEKEALKKAELEKKRRLEEEKQKILTPEDKERIRLQEEEDQLMLAKELMGVKIESTGIEAMKPTTAQEFTEFSKALQGKITQFEHHPLYISFLEEFFRELSVSLSAESTKKLGSTLSTMANEKQKAEKAVKGGKKKKGPSIAKVRDNDFQKENEYEYDDMDDFM